MTMAQNMLNLSCKHIYIVRVAMDTHSVLIIDNDLDNVSKLSRALKKMGLHVEEASDSKLALEKLHKSLNDFDLIFVEQRMPAFSGILVLQELRHFHGR
jgi:CheY-like chemotaxis protein